MQTTARKVTALFFGDDHFVTKGVSPTLGYPVPLLLLLLSASSPTGSSKINGAKLSDACSVRANWLCMGWPFCLAEMRREFQTGGNYFCTTLYLNSSERSFKFWSSNPITGRTGLPALRVGCPSLSLFHPRSHCTVPFRHFNSFPASHLLGLHPPSNDIHISYSMHHRFEHIHVLV